MGRGQKKKKKGGGERENSRKPTLGASGLLDGSAFPPVSCIYCNRGDKTVDKRKGQGMPEQKEKKKKEKGGGTNRLDSETQIVLILHVKECIKYFPFLPDSISLEEVGFSGGGGGGEKVGE